MTNLQKFIELTLENYGATFHPNTQKFNPPHGYIVALSGGEKNVTDKFNVETLQDYLDWHKGDFAKGRFLGAWIDKGQIYLDVCVHIQDEREAKVTGVKNFQKSIWDCNNQKEIKLPRAQKHGTLTQQKMSMDEIIATL